jgi:hypothetical protein
MSIVFDYEKASLPVDTWFDEVGFIDGAALPPPDPSGGAAGQGNAP